MGMNYLIREEEKERAEKIIHEIRKLIKEHNWKVATHKMMKLNDIFLNLKEHKPYARE